MVSSSISNSRYTYIHGSKWPNEAVDMHQIIVKKSCAKGFLVYFFALIILANAFYLFLVKVCLISSYFTYFSYKAFYTVLLFKSLFLRSYLQPANYVVNIKLKPRSLGVRIMSQFTERNLLLLFPLYSFLLVYWKNQFFKEFYDAYAGFIRIILYLKIQSQYAETSKILPYTSGQKFHCTCICIYIIFKIISDTILT